MITTDAILEQAHALWEQAVAIWLAGGWAMVAIAVNAFVLFALGIHVHLKLRGKGFRSVPEPTWRRWIGSPGERTGPVGELLDFVTGAPTLKELGVYFRELHTTEIVPFSRDLRVNESPYGLLNDPLLVVIRLF